jgi:hypothetical protein
MHVLRIDMVRFNMDVAAGDEGLLGPPGYWGQPRQEGGETVNVFWILSPGATGALIEFIVC